MEQLGQQVIRMVPRGPIGLYGRRRPVDPPVRAEDFSPALRTRLLVLQPTPFCNIDCSYCYLPQRNERARMPLATVRLAARRLREDGLLDDALTVVWHAGEPLVLPPAYYDDAFAAVAEELAGATQVTHAMQTNATLVDTGWCDFFLRHGVAVGISVDGPAAIHDRNRRTRAGRGTHAKVQAAMALLRQRGVPFHAIAVVGAATLADPDGFYDWFDQQGVAELGCNVDEAEGAHRQSSLAGHEAQHAAFLQRLLERSRSGRVVVRELAAAWRLLHEPLPTWQWRQHRWPDNTQAMPLALITVGHDGAFGTFSPELLGQPWPAYDNFVLGHVQLGGYVAALQGAAFTRLWHGISRGLQACERSCTHFAYCGGGAPANKLYEHGDLAATETLHCRSMVRRPFDAVLHQAEAELGLLPLKAEAELGLLPLKAEAELGLLPLKAEAELGLLPLKAEAELGLLPLKAEAELGLLPLKAEAQLGLLPLKAEAELGLLPLKAEAELGLLPLKAEAELGLLPLKALKAEADFALAAAAA